MAINMLRIPPFLIAIIAIIFFVLTFVYYFLFKSILKQFRIERKKLAQSKIELEKKTKELSFLYKTTSFISAINNVEQMIENFTNEAKDTFNIGKCFVLYFDDSSKLKPVEGFFGRKIKEIANKAEGFNKQFNVAESVIIDDVRDFPSLNDLKLKMFNLLIVPIKKGDKALGLIVCANKPGGFELDEVRMFEALAPQLGNVLFNATLLESLIRKKDELVGANKFLKQSRAAFLNILEDLNAANNELEKAIKQSTSMYNIAVEIGRTLKEEKIIGTILENVISLVDCQSGSILISSSKYLSAINAKNFPMDDHLVKDKNSLFNHVMHIKKPFLINGLKKELKSFLGVPLVQGNRCIGVLGLVNKEGGFNEDHLKLLVTLANQATVALLNSRLYQEEKKTVTRLKEIDKLKQDFISSVSHELRSPLTSIKGYLDLLLEGFGGKLNEEQMNFLNIINKSSDRLLFLITDLLTISKIESKKLKMDLRPTSLGDVLRKVAEIMNNQAKQKNLELIVNVPHNLPVVLIDPNRIEQVVTNFVSNSIKFTDLGYVELSAFVQDGCLVTRVKDSGFGISVEDQKKLFTKFFRSAEAVKRQTMGTGLGLAITKSIVEQHKGKIWFESQLKQGSSFYFSLPIESKKRKAA